MENREMSEDVERLKQHGTRYRLNGLPLYDYDVDDGRTPYAVVDEPLWSWDDLTPGQRAHIEDEARDERLNMPFAVAIYCVAAHYGVSCPHKWKRFDPPMLARECLRCRVIETLPGRYVRLNDGWVHVTDPPPHIYRVPVCRPITAIALVGKPYEPGTPDLDVVEYEYDGTGAYRPRRPR